MIPLEDVPEAIFAKPNVLWPGRGAMLLHYPVSRGKTMNVIGIAVQPAWHDEGWAIPTEPAEFQAQFDEYPPAARALLAAVPEGALFTWRLRDRDPMTNWVNGKLAMHGDAAHPISPFPRHGAVMALEAVVLVGRRLGTYEDRSI